MYCSFYGISEKPFNITPDPKYLFFGSTHKEAFAHLVYGIRERGGFVAITGEIGTGKTTLCRGLLEYLDKDTLVAFIFNPTLSALELLRTINEDFGIPSQGATKKELIDELNQFLLLKKGEGKNPILIIDEAQNLDPEVLEQIRLLSNLETNTEKLLQIILIGQPELRQILEQSGLKQLNQRITVRYHLKPLSHNECVEYIRHRLAVVGAEDKIVFRRDALRKIYNYSKGIPRLINVLCDRALLAGYTLGNRELDGSIIDRAQKEVFGEKGIIQKPLGSRHNWNGIASGIAMAVIVLFVAYGGHLFLRQHPIASSQKDIGDSVSLQPQREVGTPVSQDSMILPDQDLSPSVRAMEREEAPASVERSDAGSSAAQPRSPPTMDISSLKDLFKKTLEDKTFLESKRISLMALLRRWKEIPPEKVLVSEEDDSDVCRVSSLFALDCTHVTGSVNLLRALDLPAIMVLNFGGTVGRRYVCLLALEEDEARIAPALDNGDDKVPLSVLVDYWYGDAYLFWKDYKAGGRLLVRGVAGGDVVWLQGGLKHLGYHKGEVTGIFDTDTEMAVQSLQKDHYLEEDGVLGPQTKIVLYHALREYSMPTLISR